MKPSFVIRLFLLLFALAAICPAGWAQRKNVLGTQIDFMGGASNQIGQSNFSLAPFQSGMAPFCAVYPTLLARSDGAQSRLDASYTFMWERYDADSVLTTMSHVVDTNFTARPGKRVRLRLSESFNNAPAFSTINVFRGIVFSPEGFRYVFAPALLQRSGLSNTASAGLDLDVGPASYLTFGSSSSYRHYENIASFRGLLSDQVRIEGNLAYSRKLSTHHTWSVKYSVAEYRFKDFGNARTHRAGMSYFGDLSPSLKLAVEAGPSYTRSARLGLDYLGFYTSLSVYQSIRSNRFSLYYRHSSGDSSGMGAISDVDNAGLAFSRAFGRRTALTMDVSAFRGQGKLDNSYNTRGLSGATALSFALKRCWFLSLGGSYRKIDRSTILNSAYERLYVSIRYAAPDLSKGSR